MATSVIDLDISDIFNEAFEMAGESFHSGYDVRQARRALTFVMDEWANRGLNLWTLDEQSLAIDADYGTYSLDADTIDIIDCVIRSDDVDYRLRRIGVGEYNALSQKGQTGRPTTYFVERLTTPVIRLWPVPDLDYTLVYWRLRRLESLASGAGDDETADVPHRFRPALAAGIAKRIAILKQKWNIVPALTAEYEAQFELAAAEDRDRSSYWITPDIGRVI